MIKHFALAVALFVLLSPLCALAAEIQQLINKIKFELTVKPAAINLQFKDIDVIGKSEKWCYLFSVTNKTDKTRSFTAEINIYDDRGIVIHTAGIIYVPDIAPHSQKEVMDEVHFSEELINQATEIRITGQGFY